MIPEMILMMLSYYEAILPKAEIEGSPVEKHLSISLASLQGVREFSEVSHSFQHCAQNS